MQSSSLFKTFYQAKRTQNLFVNYVQPIGHIYTQNKLDKNDPFKWKSIYQVLTISEHISLSPLN